MENPCKFVIFSAAESVTEYDCKQVLTDNVFQYGTNYYFFIVGARVFGKKGR